MFTDQKKFSGQELPAQQLQTGMWLVRAPHGQYRAWRYWLAVAFHKRGFPDNALQVWSEWPPSTQLQADQVAVALSEIRDSIGYAKAVPRHPEPWNGYIPPEEVMDVP